MQRPYLLFLGDVGDQLAAKTAHGIVHWRPDWCLGQLRLPGCKPDLGIDGDGHRRGGRRAVPGPWSWRSPTRAACWPRPGCRAMVEALEAGLDVASGLHQRLADFPAIAEAARATRPPALRRPPPDPRASAPAPGVKRSGKRLLTVGTDCSCGKKYTALAIEREMRARGWNADFRATGQTGIMIAGEGVAIDAVVADFIAGAVEWLAPDNDPGHWDVIEGQGSLFHPAFAGVSMGLLHGAQPDALVLCHEPTRTPHARPAAPAAAGPGRVPGAQPALRQAHQPRRARGRRERQHREARCRRSARAASPRSRPSSACPTVDADRHRHRPGSWTASR